MKLSFCQENKISCDSSSFNGNISYNILFCLFLFQSMKWLTVYYEGEEELFSF